MDNSTPGKSEDLVRYLDGELPGGEQKLLEQQLATDEQLKQEYDNLLLTREAIRYYGLQQKVNEVHQGMMPELMMKVQKASPVRRMIKYSIGIAASIILLVGGFLLFNFFTLSPEKVFSANYQVYEPGTQRDGTTAETPVEKAFREKNYQEIIRIHDAGEDHSQKGEFLCGIAALELKNNDKAVKCFNEVIDLNKQTTADILNDDAEFYLSLSYIQDKDYDGALQLLNKIKTDPQHIYHEKVTNKLLRQVRMLKWK